jgi:hypothetical protein
VDPSVVLQLVTGGGAPVTQRQQAPASRPVGNDPTEHFVARVLGETEDT